MKENRLAFGPFRIDPVALRLWRGSRALPLAPKPVALLYYLARNAGRLVTKQEILDHVWPGVHVCDAALKNNIAAVRHALGDAPRTRAFVETQARRGYRFIGGVERGNLPERQTPFVGRRSEVRTGAALVAGRRLITLTGPPGCGKTALACEIARRVRPMLPDGVWWVDLGSAPRRQPLERLAAEQLGLPATPRHLPLEGVRQAVDGRQLLIILDGCDGQLREASEFTWALLNTAAGVRVLLTSGAPSGLPGEQLMAVPPMTIPDQDAPLSVARKNDAVRCFAQRASQADAGFALSERNVRSVVAICRRVEGLPGAIEQAAGHVGMLAPDEILQRLDELLALPLGLGSFQPGLPLCERFSRAIALLADEERQLLPKLAGLHQPFTLDDASRLRGDGSDRGPSPVELLTRLVRRSLVTPASPRVSGPSRYRILGPLRRHLEHR